MPVINNGLLDGVRRCARSMEGPLRSKTYGRGFIENNLCGQMPIRLDKGPKGEPEFRFRQMNGPKEERLYRLTQTVVRRVREPGDVPKKSVAPSSTKAIKH